MRQAAAAQAAMMRAFRRWLRRMRRHPARDLLLVAEAAARMILARMALATGRFESIARHHGGLVPPRAATNPPAPDEHAAARRIAWAVQVAVRHLPVRMVCLPQALAAQAMLRRRGVASILHFGTIVDHAAEAGHAPHPLRDAHAWLDAGCVPVTGYPLDPSCIEIACLIQPTRTIA